MPFRAPKTGEDRPNDRTTTVTKNNHSAVHPLPGPGTIGTDSQPDRTAVSLSTIVAPRVPTRHPSHTKPSASGGLSRGNPRGLPPGFTPLTRQTSADRPQTPCRIGSPHPPIPYFETDQPTIPTPFKIHDRISQYRVHVPPKQAEFIGVAKQDTKQAALESGIFVPPNNGDD